MQPIIHVDADFLSYDTIDWIIDWRNKNACNSPFDAKNAGMERMERMEITVNTTIIQEEVKAIKQNMEKYNILENVIKSIVRKYNKI